MMHRATITMLAWAALVAPSATAAEPASKADRVQPWHKNAFYWQYLGKPLVLIGGSDDDNLFQWPEKRLREQLDRLADCGGNYIRNTMSDRPDKGFEVYPFERLEDGRYDLEKWNDEYWKRFRRLLDWTAERHIIVQIEIWDRFDYTDQGGRNRWQRHPYNPKNNINYSYDQSGFARRYPQHPGANRQPFFFTTPKQRNNKVVLKYQQRFVDRLLSISLPYGNVLYCIDNETSGEEAWGRYWAQFIRRRADEANVKVCITEMWDDWNVTGGRHRRTFDHPDIYDFVDISQNNHNKYDRHWNNALAVRRYLGKRPRPINTVKTYGADGNKFGHSDNDGIERFWRHLLAGCAAARFHRPDSGLGLNAKAQASIRAARQVESLVPFWSLRPATDRLSDRKANEAFAGSDPGHAHVVYFPAAGAVTLKLKSGAWRLHWVSVASGRTEQTTTVRSTGGVKLRAPANGHWVAVLLAEESGK